MTIPTSLEHGPHERQTVKVALELDHGVAACLRREAARRDTTLDYLLRNLLGTIADDRLTTAILDDGADLPG
jgi:hypothetical protein